MIHPRILRGLDAKTIAAVAALAVAFTLCTGFWQRGQFLERDSRHIAEQSAQLAQLLADNDQLHAQLDDLQRTSAQAARDAAAERDRLQVELLRLNWWLREHGIHVPARIVGTSRTATAPHKSPSANPGGGGGGGPSAGPTPTPTPDAPGKSDGHRHGHKTPNPRSHARQ